MWALFFFWMFIFESHNMRKILKFLTLNNGGLPALGVPKVHEPCFRELLHPHEGDCVDYTI